MGATPPGSPAANRDNNDKWLCMVYFVRMDERRRLSTWGEIATFFECDVRTAQRWVKTRGLPVRKLPGGQRNSVFAYEDELRAWLNQAPPEQPDEVTGSGETAEPAEATPAQSIALSPVASGKPGLISRRTLIGVAAASAPVAAVAAYWSTRRPVTPEQAVLTGNLLTVLDGLGRAMWTYRFQPIPNPPRAPTERWPIQVVDLEGGGDPGVLVTCNYSENAASPTSEFYYFSGDGKLKWKRPCTPDLLDYKGQPFEKSWSVSHVVTVPSSKGHSVWASFKHGWRFAGGILQLNAKGDSHAQFANGGHLDRLCHWNRDDRDWIAFCGTSNAYAAGCAGVLEAGDPPSSPPRGGLERYRCANSPNALPRAYVLFPTPELARAARIPYTTATHITSHESGLLVEVSVYDGAYLGYQLTRLLEPDVVWWSGSYPLRHQQSEQQGALRHPFANCPEMKRPLTLRRFEQATGWRDREIAWRLSSPG